MGIWIAAVIVLALAVLPLGIRFRYNDKGFFLKVIAGPLKIPVFPRRKGKSKKEKPKGQKKQLEKPAQKEEKPKEEKMKPSAETEPKESGGSLTRFLPLVKLGLRFLGDFRRKLRLNHLYLRLTLAGDDPCDLAVNYGRAWAAVGNFMPQLERIFVIKKRDIAVQCDFTAEKTTVIAHLDITITLGRLLVLAVCYGVRVLIEYLAMKRKGGVKI